MADPTPEFDEPSKQRREALSRWDNEGGAGFGGPSAEMAGEALACGIPDLTNVELVHLRVRLIALENLVLALLAGATDRQVDLAREMAGYIAPRPGHTPHPLTTHAAAHMEALAQRAARFREPPSAPAPYRRTAVFDEVSLPEGLRNEHRTKPGVWGVIRVLDGRLRYRGLAPAFEDILQPGRPGLIQPDQPHCVEPLGPVRLQIEFYDHPPEL